MNGKNSMLFELEICYMRVFVNDWCFIILYVKSYFLFKIELCKTCKTASPIPSLNYYGAVNISKISLIFKILVSS